MTHRRQVLTRESEDGRRVLRFQRKLPAFQRFNGIRRAEHVEVRHGAQARQMLDRLVRRAVFAEADRIMRHYIDDALVHQRREADRRAAIIGKDEESARIGNEALMERNAVHGCRHAVLANAVMDEGA